MAKYRKKPVIVEAFKMGIDPIPDWFMDKVTANEVILHSVPFHESRPHNYGQTYCDIMTLEGTMRGDYGDYIIKGVQGEIYPCKPDIFEQTYEPVEEYSEQVEKLVAKVREACMPIQSFEELANKHLLEMLEQPNNTCPRCHAPQIGLHYPNKWVCAFCGMVVLTEC